MAETQLESGQETPETVAPPAPTISEPSGVQQTSAVAVSAEALAKEVATLREQIAAIPDLVERKFQSGKDRRFQVLEGLDPEALRRFNAYVKKFGDEDEAVRQMQIDAMLTRQSSPAADQGRSAVAETRDTAVILAEVRQDLGVEIAPDDAELIELSKKTYSSWDAWDKTVHKMAAKRLKQTGVATSSVVAETPQKPPQGGSLEAAQQKLSRLQNDPKAPSRDLEKALVEYRELLSRQR